EEDKGFCFEQSDFLSIEEFKYCLQQNSQEKYNFDDVIGAYGSLKDIVDNLKAGVKYPPRGLPILLTGEKGTGRKLLVKSVYKYAKSQRIIDSHSHFIVIDILDLEDYNLILPILFGNQNNLNQYPSQILKSQNGIVYIRNTQCLHEKTIKKIIDYFNIERMEDSLYTLCHQSTTRLILESTISSQDKSQCLSQDIPLVCQIPALHERYNEEKEAYIYRYFQKESQKINKRIMVSTHVIRRLLAFQYEDNIDGLENIIQLICANANADHDNKDVIKIYSYHLPTYILSFESHDVEDYSDELSFVDVMSYQQGQENEQLEKIFDSLLLDSEVLFLDANKNIDQWLSDTKRHTQQYFEYLKFNKRIDQKQMRNIEFSIGDIIDNIFETYNMNEPTNFTSLVSKSIFFIKENRSFINAWFPKNQKKMQEFLLVVQQLFKNEFEIIERMSLYIYDSLGIKFDDINKIIYTVHLSEYVRGIIKKKCLGIIVSHCYSTASSIADAVNTMIGRNVFDSIDMPIETTTNEIVDKIKKYLVRVVTRNDLLVMVDMGSLQDIGDSLMDVAQSDIGVINNVSTGLALEAGYMILRNESLPRILENVKSHSLCSSRYIQNKKVQPSIIFTSENGVNAARRLSELFVRSLPKNIDVDILTCDYFELMNPTSQEEILKNKHVFFIFGVSNPHIPEIPFVSLE
ncbi:MAG: sigma 54-interacting transcriptional regulator, partial [Coprobacillus sp.]